MKKIKLKKIKLAICTPSAGYVRVEFTETMINLSKALSKDKDVLDHKFFYICGSVIPYNRQWTVEQAILWGATHVLFVDDDMSFPPQAVKELLKNKQYPIIAANCVKRVFPKEFMSRWFDGSEVVTNKDSSGVVEVMGTGNALCLIDIGVFGVVSKPWFAFPYIPETGGLTQKTFSFKKKLDSVALVLLSAMEQVKT